MNDRVDELGERVIAAMYVENTGNKYNRQHVIAERGIDALIESTLIPVELCEFKNANGWCKLVKGHTGSHTVIYLGD